MLAAPERLAVVLALGAAPMLVTDLARAEEADDLVAPAQGDYMHFLGALAVGRGIRFNNPYRLATPLGDDAESLSLTQTYLDASITGTLGDPSGLQHGASVHMSFTLAGVPQEVVTPSYVALLRLPPRVIAYGRFGLPVILEPDLNLGYEMALGSVLLLSAGIGVTAELVGDLFYGAATQDSSVSTIPVLSLQAGVAIDYEVLP